MLTKIPVSAYIPCYNNADTIVRVIESIRSLSYPVSELFIIDDGSTDNSAAIAIALGVQVFSHEQNLGRGAARARAMIEAKHEWVLCCDGNKILQTDFIEQALPWLTNNSDNNAAIFGVLTQASSSNIAERWRGRHLLKYSTAYATVQSQWFASYGALVRKSVVLKAGNYNSQMRHNEDGELGLRLLALGYSIISDNKMVAIDIGENSVHQVLERFWRWNSWNRGQGEDLSWSRYGKSIVASFQSMMVDDLAAGDLLSVAISLYSPHYQFWRSFWKNHFTES